MVEMFQMLDIMIYSTCADKAFNTEFSETRAAGFTYLKKRER